jgi:colanic acid biosynthesis glycosyl transferase WcaI
MTEAARDSDPLALPIRWLFIGGGALYENLRSEAAKRRLKSIDFQAYQPRERLSESLSAADVHIVALRPELEGLIVPSKFYGVAAAGRPILFIGGRDGEIARLITRNACGVTVAIGDGAGLADAVSKMARDPDGCRMMGERARVMCEAHFSKNRAIDTWHDLLNRWPSLSPW